MPQPSLAARAAALAATSLLALSAPGANPAWSIDFATVQTKDGLPAESKVKGKPGAATARFSLAASDGAPRVLRMEADNATGALCLAVKGVDLSRNPILRWRWRVLSFPAGADGRVPAKDDQAIGVYLGTGGIRQKSVAYRWETDTPVGSSGEASYGAGFVKVKWFCLRDKNDGAGVWKTEWRDVAADFKAAYGFIPDEFGLSVSCNSQYTGTTAVAELAWIEFRSQEDSMRGDAP